MSKIISKDFARISAPCLVVTSDEGLGSVYRLSEAIMRLGSSESADLYLPMRGVESLHVSIAPKGEGWCITSESDNLVLHNGQVVTSESELLAGDCLELGSVRLKFKFLDEEDERYHEALRQLAIRDGLTGLYNPRYFFDALDKEHEYSYRKQTSLALLFMDIDHFKLVNDRFGHGYGDFVLRELSNLLTTKSRGYDLLARYGGEEFVFLVREESHKSVHELAHRICRDVRNHVFTHQDVRAQLTVSVGYFWWDGLDRETTAGDLLRVADDNLYAAKSAGRNCVIPAEFHASV